MLLSRQHISLITDVCYFLSCYHYQRCKVKCYPNYYYTRQKVKPEVTANAYFVPLPSSQKWTVMHQVKYVAQVWGHMHKRFNIRKEKADLLRRPWKGEAKVEDIRVTCQVSRSFKYRNGWALYLELVIRYVSAVPDSVACPLARYLLALTSFACVLVCVLVCMCPGRASAL